MHICTWPDPLTHPPQPLKFNIHQPCPLETPYISFFLLILKLRCLWQEGLGRMDRAHCHSYCSIQACVSPLPCPCLTSSSPGLCLLPLSSGVLSSTSSLPVNPSYILAVLTPRSFPLSNPVMLPGTFLLSFLFSFKEQQLITV